MKARENSAIHLAANWRPEISPLDVLGSVASRLGTPSFLGHAPVDCASLEREFLLCCFALRNQSATIFKTFRNSASAALAPLNDNPMDRSEPIVVTFREIEKISMAKRPSRISRKLPIWTRERHPRKKRR